MNKKDLIKIDSMKKGGRILALILQELKEFSIPGKNTEELESYSNDLLQKYNAKSAFKNFNGYKYNLCVSLNDEIVHGMPINKIIQNQDIVSIDMGVLYNGYNTDSAITFGIGKINKQMTDLIITTKKALMESIKLIKPNNYLGNIQSKIQKTIERLGYNLVKNLTGHGIGKKLQENPIIENYGNPNTGLILKSGMTFCLEPMATLGNGNTKIQSDGWTIKSIDGSNSAHFEHTIAVTDNGYDILTKI